jgi:hypothetical protein
MISVYRVCIYYEMYPKYLSIEPTNPVKKFALETLSIEVS